MYKYKNVSDSEQSLTGFGLIKPGQEFTTSRVVDNPNFDLLESDQADEAAATENVAAESEQPQEQPTNEETQ